MLLPRGCCCAWSGANASLWLTCSLPSVQILPAVCRYRRLLNLMVCMSVLLPPRWRRRGTVKPHLTHLLRQIRRRLLLAILATVLVVPLLHQRRPSLGSRCVLFVRVARSGRRNSWLLILFFSGKELTGL